MQSDNIFDRLAQGPGGQQSSDQGAPDYNDWNQMVGSAPPDRFGNAVQQSIQQVDPREYADHVTPGVGGTDPLGQLEPQQRGGLLSSVLGALTGSGANMGSIQQATGINNMDPYGMSPNQAAGLLQYAQQNHPQAFGQVAQQYQNEPNLLQSLLGNKAMMMAAGAVGSKLLSDQMNRNNHQR